MPTPSAPRGAYVRLPRRARMRSLLDAYANELRLGDEVTPAAIPGPPQLPARTYGRCGTVVSLGRIRVGVRFGSDERVELLPARPLLVTRAGDGRTLLGPRRA